MSRRAKRRAILVVGPESSGTRALSQVMIEAGAYGQSTHRQVMDGGSLDDKPDVVVIRRSVPHAKQWPDLANLVDRFERAGYRVHPVMILRDPVATAKSQMRNGYVRDAMEASKNIARASWWIVNGLSEIGMAPTVVSYESLCDQSVLESIVRAQGLDPSRVTSWWRDENAKYR